MKFQNKDKALNAALLSFLLIFPVWLAFKLSSLDKVYFLCPIDYKGRILIRRDICGEGDFAASRRGKRRHSGVDLQAELGTEVRASKRGLVINAEFDAGLGNYVEIIHPNQLVTIYAHLSSFAVKKGERVRQGQIIGRVGKTGNARDSRILPHLHLEIRKEGCALDPFEGYLPR